MADNKNPTSEARTVAARRLREQYPDQWNKILGEEMGKRGLTFRPKLSAEEKADQQIQELLKGNPNLAKKYRVQDS